MGLVNSDETNVPRLEGFEHLLGHESFRRQIKDLVPSAAQVLPAPSVLVRRQRGIEERRRYAELFQAIDLILHQRDQRRYDDREPIVGDRGKLIAQRLAAPGRQQCQDILPGEQALDDLPLKRSKRLETEMTLQKDIETRLFGVEQVVTSSSAPTLKRDDHSENRPCDRASAGHDAPLYRSYRLDRRFGRSHPLGLMTPRDVQVLRLSPGRWLSVRVQ